MKAEWMNEWMNEMKGGNKERWVEKEFKKWIGIEIKHKK